MLPKRKRDDETKEPETTETKTEIKTVWVQFKSTEGEIAGGKEQLQIPYNSTLPQLKQLINALLDNEEVRPYSFFLDEDEIKKTLQETIEKTKKSIEELLVVRYEPQAIFRVRPVTRCSATIEGHTEAVLHVHFSADGKKLASGSGDCTVRLWDVDTQTPIHTLTGHKHWVLAVAWAPNGKLLASGDNKGMIYVWDPETGKKRGKMPLRGHTKAVVDIAWEPFFKNDKCTRICSASLDGGIKVWDVVRAQCLRTLAGHTGAVHAVRWGGAGLLYSGSHDRTIKVWEADTGKLVRTLSGHAHRVNTLTLNVDYALRTGPFDQKGEINSDEKKAVEEAKEKYRIACAGRGELLASGSDDFTLYLWDPTADKKGIVRMTGHQQPVNFALYSPDGRYIASACFDKSVRIWDGRTGKFVAVLRAHVQAVYQLSWSSDSRLLLSSSKDSTIKLWDALAGKLMYDLPGHADEVYAIDWSPNGSMGCSGGKDRVLKIWKR